MSHGEASGCGQGTWQRGRWREGGDVSGAGIRVFRVVPDVLVSQYFHKPHNTYAENILDITLSPKPLITFSETNIHQRFGPHALKKKKRMCKSSTQDQHPSINISWCLVAGAGTYLELTNVWEVY